MGDIGEGVVWCHLWTVVRNLWMNFSRGCWRVKGEGALMQLVSPLQDSVQPQREGKPGLSASEL